MPSAIGPLASLPAKCMIRRRAAPAGAAGEIVGRLRGIPGENWRLQPSRVNLEAGSCKGDMFYRDADKLDGSAQDLHLFSVVPRG